MWKKIVIGALVLTVVGSGSAALAYQAASSNNVTPVVDTVQNQQGNTGLQQTGSTGDVVISQDGSTGNQNRQSGNSQQREQQDVASIEMAGEPWSGSGFIRALDDFGMTLAVDGESEIYVELGPPTYWQEQGVALEAGQYVIVDGFVEEEMYHAATVATLDGQQLILRNETGQPMWSGGASKDGDVTPDSQVQVDEWVTVEGIITEIAQGMITIQMADGTLLTFQTGKQSFFEEQGVYLQVGDEIIVLGFYENGQFMAGEITQVSTGLRIMLRDPNGRPLWAGAGGSGGQGGGGQGGGGQGGGGQGQGGNGGNGGNGKGGNGGNGNGGNGG